MSVGERLGQIQQQYIAWHGDRGTHTPAPDSWDADPGESMDHYIVRQHVPEMYTALRAVLDLHKPRNGNDCGHCVDPADAHWGIPWPCPTVRAIESAMGVAA